MKGIPVCICGHPKCEHDEDGVCTVDYLLCWCAEYVRDDPNLT